MLLQPLNVLHFSTTLFINVFPKWLMNKILLYHYYFLLFCCFICWIVSYSQFLHIFTNPLTKHLSYIIFVLSSRQKNNKSKTSIGLRHLKSYFEFSSTGLKVINCFNAQTLSAYLFSVSRILRKFSSFEKQKSDDMLNAKQSTDKEREESLTERVRGRNESE